MTTQNRYWLDIFFTFWTSSRLGRAMSIVVTSALRLVHPAHSTTKRSHIHHVAEKRFEKSMEELTAEIKMVLQTPVSHAERLLDMSGRLIEEYREKLQSSDISMLPSYMHTLPTGNERGDVLALDVGGSTFRIAWIRLAGKRNGIENGLQIRSIHSFPIDNDVRALKGVEFFDWMSDRIGEMLVEYNNANGTSNAHLEMGLAWSFPIHQTSTRTGKLLPMGKGFRATHGVEGEDLGELIMQSCSRKGLNVEIQAIVNDGDATLLSQAYRNQSTRMSLILGTGTNAAVYLPVSTLSKEKYGQRPDSWYDAAKHVIVNTEMSMVGKHVLPTTKWDDQLNATHILPDFQPLEYLTTGRYLGEIVRLILVDAIHTAGLFEGRMPHRLTEPYSLDTRVVAAFEMDRSSSLAFASRTFLAAHPLSLPPRLAELEFIRDVSAMVSRRAACYLATALHALWSLRTAAEGLELGAASQVAIACNGTIIEKYPGFRARCQRQLDELCELSGASAGSVVLEMAPESTLLGAAVAACVGGES